MAVASTQLRALSVVQVVGVGLHSDLRSPKPGSYGINGWLLVLENLVDPPHPVEVQSDFARRHDEARERSW